MDFYPFFVDFITVILLIIAAILFCSLFNEISKGRLRKIAYTIFACFFITYPLVMEIFTYVPMGISISLGFIAIALSLISYTEYLNTNKTRYMIFSVLMIWLAVSLYESFAVVYVLGVFAIKVIELLYADEKKKLRDVIKDCILYFIPLLLGIMINYIFAYCFKKIFNIPENTKASRTILYFKANIGVVLKYLLHTIIVEEVLDAFGYLPITFLVISFIISIIMACVTSIRKKNISILLVFLGMQLSIFLLSIIQGHSAGYRMSQQFYLFVPVIFMILVQMIMDSNMKKILKNIAMFVICLMLFYQVKDLYNWQYLNDIRYQKEKSDAILIANEIMQKYGNEKPIIFVGTYEMPEQLEKAVRPNELHRKILEYYNQKSDMKIDMENIHISHTNLQSYIAFGMVGHITEGIPGVELIKFFKYLGYDFKTGTMDMYNEAKKIENDLPNWPQKGSIVEMEEYIVVNF